MTLWDRIKARFIAPERSIQNRVISYVRTDAGVVVGYDQALGNDVVWACVNYLSRSIAQLPWRVMREMPNGDMERVPTNPVDYLLDVRPNPEMSAFSFRQAAMGWLLLKGNFYAEIERDLAGRVLYLWPVHPDRIKPERDEDGVLFYKVWNGTDGWVRAESDQIFHVKGFGQGVVGLDVITYAAQSIGWANATAMFGSRFFGDGANPSGVVEVERPLTQEGFNALRAKFKAVNSGPQGEKTIFLDKGMTFKPMSVTPNESQFVETRQHQVEQICRWFGVPPHKVMHLARATFSNIEHQSIEVVVDSIVPWARSFEQEADYKLFGQNRSNLRTKMNVNGLLRGDSAARAALYQSMFSVGAASPNSILRREDMNSIGPDGDRHFVPQNMVPLDKVDQMQSLNAQPPGPA